MGVVNELVKALLEVGESPKEFFRRMRNQGPKPAARYIPPPVRAEDAREWLEFEDLEPWEQAAALEMQAEVGTEFELKAHDGRIMDLIAPGNDWYRVYQDEAVAEHEAVEQVKNDLDDSPENFTQSWLEDFIDMDRVRSDLYEFAKDEDYWNEQYSDFEAKRDYLIEQGTLDEDDFRDEEGNELEPTPDLEQVVDNAFEEMMDSYANNRLRNPLEFLEEIYGREDAVKKAMEIGGIDTARAAQSAVDTDGVGHFLSSYDGELHDLPGDAVYVRQ